MNDENMVLRVRHIGIGDVVAFSVSLGKGRAHRCWHVNAASLDGMGTKDGAVAEFVHWLVADLVEEWTIYANAGIGDLKAVETV